MKLAQAEEQIVAKGARRHRFVERPVRRGDDAHVDASAVACADRLVLASRERPQQHGLGACWKIADLVQEEGAGVRLREGAG